MADKVEHENELRCPICLTEWPRFALEGATCCPGCKAKVPPRVIAHDTTFKMNWEDMRLLANWAASWQSAALMDNVFASRHLENIFAALDAGRPAGTRPLLIEGGGGQSTKRE